jgi:hypothetical protein
VLLFGILHYRVPQYSPVRDGRRPVAAATDSLAGSPVPPRQSAVRYYAVSRLRLNCLCEHCREYQEGLPFVDLLDFEEFRDDLQCGAVRCGAVRCVGTA